MLEQYICIHLYWEKCTSRCVLESPLEYGVCGTFKTTHVGICGGQLAPHLHSCDRYEYKTERDEVTTVSMIRGSKYSFYHLPSEASWVKSVK